MSSSSSSSSSRNISSPLSPPDLTESDGNTNNNELLLVAQYAWDSNAYPGNEYWLGSLSGSGDPAAVCCSTVGEIQNPAIHPEAFERERLVYWDDKGEMKYVFKT
eukprot:CAMPEP_0182426294 /NCGR_PEP_ID=MMETSP1167-20130531/12781_1 /TAXON_ID=2988 /ORGANISM="Mallomonas Sp, Strain CCMP3275" /LENGTH=104 /DNA_ID=CAMNT_0024607623 /DNA_START=683 /DNA_END=997 /DNA_ORIENTATION=+